MVLRGGRLQLELHEHLHPLRLVEDRRPERPRGRLVPLFEPDGRQHPGLSQARPRRELCDLRDQHLRRQPVLASFRHRRHHGHPQAAREPIDLQRIRHRDPFRRRNPRPEERRRDAGLHACAGQHRGLFGERLHRRRARPVGHAAVEGDGLAHDAGPGDGGQRRHLGRQHLRSPAQRAAAWHELPDRQPGRAADAGGRTLRSQRGGRGGVDAADCGRLRSIDRAVVRAPARLAGHSPTGSAGERDRLLLERGHLAVRRGQRRDDLLQPRKLLPAASHRRPDPYQIDAARPDGPGRSRAGQ